MLTVRDAIPIIHRLARAEFTTIRLRLLKLGPCVGLAFAACPKADLLRYLATTLATVPT